MLEFIAAVDHAQAVVQTGSMSHDWCPDDLGRLVATDGPGMLR